MHLARSSVVRFVGAAVAVGLILAVYLALTASKGLPGQNVRLATANFSSVGGLRVGDDVRTASVRIGQVRQIAYVNGKARVQMAIDPDQTVYRNGSAVVLQRSALGQNFVMLDPGTASSGKLPNDGSLSDARVHAPVELDQVLSVFSAKTRSATASLLRQTGQGTAGHSADLSDFLKASPGLLRDLRSVSRTLAEPSTNLSGLLSTSAELAGRFDGRADEIGSLMNNLDTTMSALGVDDGDPVDKSLQVAPAALDNTNKGLVDLQQPLKDLDSGMRALRTGSVALGRSTPTLRAALRESVPVLNKVSGVMDVATPAVHSLNGVMSDASPLADRLKKTMSSAAEATAVLAPYTPEMIRFFQYWNSANQYGDKSGHYLRIDLVIRPESVTGILPIKDPLVHRDAYPAPGQALKDHTAGLLGGQP